MESNGYVTGVGRHVAAEIDIPPYGPLKKNAYNVQTAQYRRYNAYCRHNMATSLVWDAP